MLDTWSEDIKLQNKTLQESADIPIPRYEQTDMPMINEWLGRISSADTRTIIADILQVTS